MATKTKKTAAKKQEEAVLQFEEGQWYIVQGKSKVDVGRNRRVAEQMLEERRQAA